MLYLCFNWWFCISDPTYWPFSTYCSQLLPVNSPGIYFKHTLSDKISPDKSDEISAWWRNFCPANFFVRRNFCPAIVFKTIGYSLFRRTKVTKFRLGGEIFCPAKFCPIRCIHIYGTVPSNIFFLIIVFTVHCHEVRK